MPGVGTSVVIPFIETGCKYRAAARRYVLAYWSSLGVEVVEGHGHDKPVNRSEARNAAAEKATGDVLFFCDADMWVPSDQFWAAVAVAARTDRFVLAYTRHMRLDRQATAATIAGTFTPRGQTIGGTAGGCFAVSRVLHDLVGGHDERFREWGGEDRAFRFACETLTGVEETIPGLSYHLWHPRSPELARHTPNRTANATLAERYKKAAGVRRATGVIRSLPRISPVPDASAMRAILAEPGGPRSTVGGKLPSSPTAGGKR